VRRKYPLDALSQLRRDRKEERARDLGAAQASTEAARADALRASEARRREQAAVSGERSVQRARLEAGKATVQDLQQGERFLVGAMGRVNRLALNEQAAERKLEEANRVEQRAEGELARAQADEQSIERHRERFEAAERRAAELSEDESALERWTADRYGKARA
jgi:hypothetical protein